MNICVWLISIYFLRWYSVVAVQLDLDEQFLQSIPEAQLDANRSIVIEGEQYFVPKKIPKLTYAEKVQLIKENGGHLDERVARRNSRRRRIEAIEKVRRAVIREEVDGRPSSKVQLVEKPWLTQAGPGRPKGKNKWPEVLIASHSPMSQEV
uniref:Uncharacterized protein n=1 Tax=Ditylenchus dipsaci TaxID=166011 RepID=A0A915D5J8_9BILA